VKIPLPKMMRHWREREFERHLTPSTIRGGLKLWAWFARRPGWYRAATRIGMGTLALLGRGSGKFRRLPLAGGWTGGRDLPAPEPGGTFMARYAATQRRR
jgi:L-lactate dehydrogenase complex protein LldF